MSDRAGGYMTWSTGDMRRRHHLTLLTVLAVVTPPEAGSAGGRGSVHVLAPHILVRCGVDASRGRYVRLVVRGRVMLHLVDQDRAPPAGFSLADPWIGLLEALAEPWGLLLGNPETSVPAPARRVHSQRSPYAARTVPVRSGTVGPRTVRRLAEYMASSSERASDDDRVLEFDHIRVRVTLLRTRTLVFLQVECGGRPRLAATQCRQNPVAPPVIRLWIGTRWVDGAVKAVRAAVPLADPADLVEFCRLQA